ncbi:MAG: radical SAM protein [Planctomycetota bacterium]|nr:radical SAM protein [Planctomycetota bacterium]MDG2143313.1 radical SAM protein [Planctomycetota bacterium]
MINYQGRVYRPPSEADSLILQATLGCSYNECTFCGMYRDKPFRVRKVADLKKEIEWAAQQLGDVRKVFLADGDALIAKASFLEEVTAMCYEAFPGLRRVSCYASPQALDKRTVEEMTRLREAGLTQYYLGVESGHDEVLENLKKGIDAENMIRVAHKAQEAGVKISTMILLGVGGRRLTKEHAIESARVISEINPRFVSTLVVTPVEGTPLHDQAMAGAFDNMTPEELSIELRTFVAHLELDGTIFRSNHASNYLPLAGNFPRDKARLVAELDSVMAEDDSRSYRPEWARGL